MSNANEAPTAERAPGTRMEANEFGYPVRWTITARFQPRTADDLKQGFKAYIGRIGVFRYAFTGGDDERFPCQFRWTIPDDWGPITDPIWGTCKGGLWVPDEDLELVQDDAA